MIKLSIYKCFLLIVLFNNFFLIISKKQNILAIPFSLSKKNYDNPDYNSSNFLEDNFFKYILVHLNIGTPIQNVSSQLESASKCFQMRMNDSDDDSNSNNYWPIYSTSVKQNGGKVFSDNFNFEGLNDSYSFRFQIIDYNYKLNYSKYNYIPKIGLDIPDFDDSCYNFFLSLKKSEIINKKIWTIEYINDYEGNLVIGGELSNHNEEKYPQSNYRSFYYTLKYYIDFDSAYIKNKPDNIYLNMTTSMISINYGFIIGPHEYKILIDDSYFNDLTNKNVCMVDIITYEFNKEKHVGLDYYLYSCDAQKFTDTNNNYYEQFPELIFNLKSIEYNFVFKKEDLFIRVNNKYYFLIIFQTNFDVKEIIWYLGEPFYKKYPITFNFDSKTIGLYLKDGEGDSGEDKDDNNKNIIMIIIISIEAIIFIALIIVVIIMAKSFNDMRKQRINEINDDNYEYFTEKNKKNEESINN